MIARSLLSRMELDTLITTAIAFQKLVFTRLTVGGSLSMF
jgi:hypothetical protein